MWPYELWKVSFQKTMLTITWLLPCVGFLYIVELWQSLSHHNASRSLVGTGRLVTGISMADRGCSVA